MSQRIAWPFWTCLVLYIWRKRGNQPGIHCLIPIHWNIKWASSEPYTITRGKIKEHNHTNKALKTWGYTIRDGIIYQISLAVLTQSMNTWKQWSVQFQDELKSVSGVLGFCGCVIVKWKIQMSHPVKTRWDYFIFKSQSAITCKFISASWCPGSVFVATLFIVLDLKALSQILNSKTTSRINRHVFSALRIEYTLLTCWINSW